MAKRIKKRGSPNRLFRLMKLLVALMLLVLIVPVIEVGCVRVINPPYTPMMAQRWLEAHQVGKAPRVFLRSTNQAVLGFIPLDVLKAYALDLN